MFKTIFILTIVLFLATSVTSILSLHSDKKIFVKWSRILFYLSVVLFFTTGAVRYSLASIRSLIGIALTIWGYFYLISFVMIILLLYLNISRWNKQLRSIMVLAAPFITVFLIISIPFIDSGRRIIFDIKPVLLPHILLTTIGEIFFFLSFAGSTLFLVMEWQLRKKTSMKFIKRLPNLETIEKFNNWALTRSLIFITSGLAIGIVMACLEFKSPFTASPKEIIIYISWIVILGIFLLRRRSNFHSYEICRINAVVFLIVICMYIFANTFFTTGFHSYQ